MAEGDPSSSQAAARSGLSAAEEAATASAWLPLSVPQFRRLWLATVASNIGTWIQEVGASWLMTSLAPTPLLVSLIQTATSAPFFLLALPAGALADIVDRRRILVVTQSLLLLVASSLALTTYLELTTPALLLAFTFLMGVGSAFNAPAWQANTPDLVPKHLVPAAISLGGVAMNVARAVGPAIGGLLVASVGTWATFSINAVSYLGVLTVLVTWRRELPRPTLPPERWLEAMGLGLRHVLHAPALRRVLLRNSIFVLPASVVWALLPLYARRQLEYGPTGYGFLLGLIGVGAVCGAAVLPRFRRRYGTNRVVTTASLGYGLAVLGMGFLHQTVPLVPVMIVAGLCWMSTLSSLNIAAQSAIPAYVRARAMAAYLLVFFGSMAAGSFLWGSVATATSIPTALLIAGLLLVSGVMAGRWLPVSHVAGQDHAPSKHWPAPVVVGPLDTMERPVVVTVEYRINPTDRDAFLSAVRELRTMRLRSGNDRWQLIRDTSDPTRYVEWFTTPTWLSHLRQHERVTEADRRVQDRVSAFHIGPDAPTVTHHLVERS